MAFHEALFGANAAFGFLILILFVLFALAMKKVFSIVLNALWITIAALLFPIVASTFLGLPVPTDAGSLISFVLLGLTLYLIYLFGKSVYMVLGIAEKGIKAAGFPVRARRAKKRKEFEKKLRKIVEEKDEEEKVKRKVTKAKPKTPSAPEYSEDEYLVLRETKKEAKKESFAEPLDVIEPEEEE